MQSTKTYLTFSRYVCKHVCLVLACGVEVPHAVVCVHQVVGLQMTSWPGKVKFIPTMNEKIRDKIGMRKLIYHNPFSVYAVTNSICACLDPLCIFGRQGLHLKWIRHWPWFKDIFHFRWRSAKHRIKPPTLLTLPAPSTSLSISTSPEPSLIIDVLFLKRVPCLIDWWAESNLNWEVVWCFRMISTATGLLA